MSFSVGGFRLLFLVLSVKVRVRVAAQKGSFICSILFVCQENALFGGYYGLVEDK